MEFPRLFKGGGVTKEHLDQVREDAERITLRRMRDAQEELDYKASRAEKKAKQKEAENKKASK